MDHVLGKLLAVVFEKGNPSPRCRISGGVTYPMENSFPRIICGVDLARKNNSLNPTVKHAA